MGVKVGLRYTNQEVKVKKRYFWDKLSTRREKVKSRTRKEENNYTELPY